MTARAEVPPEAGTDCAGHVAAPSPAEPRRRRARSQVVCGSRAVSGSRTLSRCAGTAVASRRNGVTGAAAGPSRLRADAVPVRAHLAQLREDGGTYEAIAAAAGLSAMTVHALLNRDAASRSVSRPRSWPSPALMFPGPGSMRAGPGCGSARCRSWATGRPGSPARPGPASRPSRNSPAVTPGPSPLSCATPSRASMTPGGTSGLPSAPGTSAPPQPPPVAAPSAATGAPAPAWTTTSWTPPDTTRAAAGGPPAAPESPAQPSRREAETVRRARTTGRRRLSEQD